MWLFWTWKIALCAHRVVILRAFWHITHLFFNGCGSDREVMKCDVMLWVRENKWVNWIEVLNFITHVYDDVMWNATSHWDWGLWVIRHFSVPIIVNIFICAFFFNFHDYISTDLARWCIAIILFQCCIFIHSVQAVNGSNKDETKKRSMINGRELAAVERRSCIIF